MPALAETQSGGQGPRISRRGLLKAFAGVAGLAVADHFLPPAVRRVIPGFSDFVSSAEAADPHPPDFPLIPPGEENMHPGVPQGWVFTQQAQAEGHPYPMGYILYNKDDVPMWTLYQQNGGIKNFGPAITDRYQTPQGTWIQLFQQGGLEYNPTTKTFGFVNAFDVMERAGIKLADTWYKVPDSRPEIWNPNLPEGHTIQNGGLEGTIEKNQIDKIFSPDLLPNVPPEKIKALRDFYLSNPNSYNLYGLPTGIDYYQNEDILAVRCQRGSIQSRRIPLPGSTLKAYEPVAIYASQAMRDYAKDTGLLVPKDALEAKYNPYGVGSPETPQQIFNDKLQALLDYTFEENGIKYPNALGLNEQEVKGYIAGTWGEADIHSFKVLRNAKGEPLAILVTGGQYGLKKDQNIANIQAAVKRLNQIDPDTFDQLTQGFGLRAITRELAPETTFIRYPGYGSTYTNDGILLFNENAQDFPIYSALARILSESRGIYMRENVVWNGSKWVFTAPDKLSDFDGVDKNLWLEKWIESHKAELIKGGEYDDIKKLADAWLQYYLDIAKNARVISFQPASAKRKYLEIPRQVVDAHRFRKPEQFNRRAA